MRGGRRLGRGRESTAWELVQAQPHSHHFDHFDIRSSPSHEVFPVPHSTSDTYVLPVYTFSITLDFLLPSNLLLVSPPILLLLHVAVFSSSTLRYSSSTLVVLPGCAYPPPPFVPPSAVLSNIGCSTSLLCSSCRRSCSSISYSSLRRRGSTQSLFTFALTFPGACLCFLACPSSTCSRFIINCRSNGCSALENGSQMDILQLLIPLCTFLHKAAGSSPSFFF